MREGAKLAFKPQIPPLRLPQVAEQPGVGVLRLRIRKQRECSAQDDRLFLEGVSDLQVQNRRSLRSGFHK